MAAKKKLKRKLKMYFCPACANLLQINTEESCNLLKCKTCPYQFPVREPLATRKTFGQKQLDDVLGGKDQWENVDQTDATCPKCEHNRAYYMQIQTRSADEPMTIFYKVTYV